MTSSSKGIAMYYWESDERSGQSRFESDAHAIKGLATIQNLLIIYKEADTQDGTPFVIVWERQV